jgi:hypothetical protein
MPEDENTAEVAVAAVSDGTISIKTGTIIAVIGALLGTGGGTGLMSMLQQPSPEVLDRLEAIEQRMERQERTQASATRLSGIIYKTIIRAHPDAAIPLEDLEPIP